MFKREAHVASEGPDGHEKKHNGTYDRTGDQNDDVGSRSTIWVFASRMAHVCVDDGADCGTRSNLLCKTSTVLVDGIAGCWKY